MAFKLTSYVAKWSAGVEAQQATVNEEITYLLQTLVQINYKASLEAKKCEEELYRYINDWNSLPSEVMSSPSLQSFKVSLIKYSTVQKKCKRNSVFFVLCSRENSAKFRYEFSSKRSRIFVESNEISPLS